MPLPLQTTAIGFAAAAALTFAAGVSFAQDGINGAQGKISDWSGRQADLLVWQIGAPPVPIGKVTEGGTLIFELPASFDATQPLSQVFSCSDGGTTSTDPDATYFITSSMLMIGLAAEEKLIGGAVAASNRAIALSRAGKAQPAAGRYYQWLYTPDDVTIEGNCAFDIFPDGKTGVEVNSTYDMALKPGWNVFEIELAEIEKVGDAPNVARQRAYRVVDDLPADAKWYYWPE